MPHPDISRHHHVLDPIARISEVLFGLIMALTFTGTLRAATAGRDEIHPLLLGMIGCNLAWGLVDAVMYLVGTLTERGRALLTIRAVRSATTPEEARRVISDAMPPALSSTLTLHEVDHLREGLLRMGGLPRRVSLGSSDWIAALGVFCLVSLSTFPMVVPFLIFDRVPLAVRSSNVIGLVMLFAVGYALARVGGYSPWRTGLSMVLLGTVLVAITIALGG